MKFRHLVIALLALSLFGSCNLALASSASSKYVDKVALTFTGMAVQIHVENQSANKHLSKVNLKTKNSSMSFDYSGHVECNPGIGRRFKGAYITFGNVSLSGEGINDTSGAYTLSTDVAHTIKKSDIAESTPKTFVVPLSKVKNVAASLRVDPIAEVNKKLQQHLAGGGNAVDFYRQDHTIVLQRPISLSALCGTNSKSSGGYETKNHVIQIEYKGDSKVYDKAVINASLANQLPNQVTNDLPFKLDKAQFQANMPNYVGKCIPNQNPKLRINFQVSGSETGLMDLRVVAVSNQYAAYGNYFATEGIVNNPKNGGGHLDFRFPLKEMLSQNQYSWMAIADNQTHSHNMRIEARYKNMQNGTWSAFKPFGTAVFKHRCTPQVNPAIDNQNKINSFGKQPDQQNLNVKKATPPRAEPKPKRAATPAPESKPQRSATPEQTSPKDQKSLRAPLVQPAPPSRKID